MLVAGNWKMHADVHEARALARAVAKAVGDAEGVTVVVCPPFASLCAVAEEISDAPILLGAQNMHAQDAGAFTGEVSAPMLTSAGCRWVILGHSERRQYFGETDEGVREKIAQAHAHGLLPILCVGETLEERKAGQAKDVVGRQLAQGLRGVEPGSPPRLAIAYEPVWAIGTGETATPEQAQEMHAFVRGLLNERFGEEAGRAVHILYGGSVKPGNAADLFGQADVDGGLIGGASLNAEDFAAIVRAGRRDGAFRENGGEVLPCRP